jgi:Flp pilus assembly protein TadB
MSMGAHPLRFLLTTGIGVTGLLAGAALAIAGVLWVERLAAAAED